MCTCCHVWKLLTVQTCTGFGNHSVVFEVDGKCVSGHVSSIVYQRTDYFSAHSWNVMKDLVEVLRFR